MLFRRFLLCCFVLTLTACSLSGQRYTLWGTSDSDYSSSTVRVKKGDTLYSIARTHDVSLREMIETNNLTPPYTVRVGQVLRLPSAKYHIVAKGDTLYNISKRYNIDTATLSRTNNLSAPYTLKIGQRLTLSGSLASSSSSVTTSTNTTKQTTASKSSSSSSSTQTTYVQPSTKRKQKFSWPVRGTVISKFGPIAKGRNNDGINIKAPKGTAVVAADTGTVAYAGNELKGFGNLILIKHDDGWVSAYAHNDTLKVRKGQRVARGTPIATVGTSGGVSQPQLHFETRAGKKALNPTAYLP
jgi:murein DD-endopeptidase MepM/ murein hydrolase activator NlpD